MRILLTHNLANERAALRRLLEAGLSRCFVE